MKTRWKSQKILKEGMDYYYKKESSGRYRIGALSLLAAQDDFFPDRALYLKKAQSEARALIKSASELSALRNYTASTAYPIPWGRAHELILLGEYYLITRDAQVFPTIEALAINLAKGAIPYNHLWILDNPAASHVSEVIAACPPQRGGGHAVVTRLASIPCKSRQATLGSRSNSKAGRTAAEALWVNWVTPPCPRR